MRAIKRGALAGWIIFALATVASAQGGIPWAHDIEQARQIAAQQNKLVLVHFWSPDCAPCMKLERYVFPNPQIARAMADNYVPVKVNAKQRRDLVQRFQVNSWPTDVIMTPQGQQLYKRNSPQSANSYIVLLSGVAQKVRSAQQQRPLDELAQAARNGSNTSRNGQFNPQGSQSGPNTRGSTSPYPNNSSTYDPRAGQYQDQPNQAPRNTTGPLPYNGGSYSDTNRQTAPTNPPYANQYQRNGAFQGTPVHDNQNQYNIQKNSPPSNNNGYSDRPEIRNNQFYGPAKNQTPRDTSPPPNRSSDTNPPQIAPGNPTLALDGYCAVSLVQNGKWDKADTRWGAIHRGRTYLFTGPTEQKTFLDNPDKFAPALAGYDPVQFLGQGKKLNGKRQHGVFYRNQIYLFTDENNLQAFQKSPRHYAQAVHQAMQQNALGKTRR